MHVISSLNIDIMTSPDLPSFESAVKRYEVPFGERDYAIFSYHSVTSELHTLDSDIHEIIDALELSRFNYIVINPNNDPGSSIITYAYNYWLADKPWAKRISSLRFEYLLTLLKHSRFVIGNSSVGVREAPFYGIPTVDIGSRQKNRSLNSNILHCNVSLLGIRNAVARAKKMKA